MANFSKLKEAYLKEDSISSRYVNSIKKQLELAGTDVDKLAQISGDHDIMLKMLKTPLEIQKDWFEKQTPWVKFHYRIAKREFDNGTLIPETVPTGMELGTMALSAASKSALEKREKREQEKKAEEERRAKLSPEEKTREDVEKEIDVVYGGRRDRSGHLSGLGT